MGHIICPKARNECKRIDSLLLLRLQWKCVLQIDLGCCQRIISCHVWNNTIPYNISLDKYRAPFPDHRIPMRDDTCTTPSITFTMLQRTLATTYICRAHVQYIQGHDTSTRYEIVSTKRNNVGSKELSCPTHIWLFSVVPCYIVVLGWTMMIIWLSSI